MPAGYRIFLLSPANCSGKRAGFLLRRDARSALAQRLRSGGATIGEVFTFMSGLYFRGKLAYARSFASPPEGAPGIQVIVPGLGLRSPETEVDLHALRAIARVPVDPDNRRYVRPLQRDVSELAARLATDDVVILLGSIATPKYVQPLGDVLGSRLVVPQEFIGRGDMSRGSLMLKCAAARRELAYVGVAEATARTTAIT